MKHKIDQVWNAFWAAGISNPQEILEQITCLIYLRQLEELHSGVAGADGPSQPSTYSEEIKHLRWSRLTEQAPQNVLASIRDEAFPRLRDLSARFQGHFGQFRSVRFTITTPSLLMKVVDLVNDFDISGASTAGALYDYLLGKIDGRFGHLRTPPDVVELLVQMMKPNSSDEICDPFCGTGELLVAAGEFVKRLDAGGPSEGVRRGFSANPWLLPIAQMNLALHGAEQSDLLSVDPLGRAADALGEYSLILANPPFGGYYEYDQLSDELRTSVGTRKTELLYLVAMLRWLKPGGRAGVVVPDGVLFGSTPAHQEIRRALVEEHSLDGVVSLPRGVFPPHSGVSASLLFFTKTNCGGTDFVWFYDMTAEEWGRDGAHSSTLADVVSRWNKRDTAERKRTTADQSFCVPVADIVANGYELTPRRYRHEHEMKKLARDGVWRLGDIAQVIAGKVRPSPADNNVDVAGAGKEQRVLRPSLLDASLPGIEDLPVTARAADSSSTLREGDVVGRDLAAARHWTVLPRHYEGVQAGQGLLVVRPVQGEVPAEYLAAYLSSPQAERSFPRYNIIPRIRPKELADLLVPACDGTFTEIRAAMTRLTEGVDEAARIHDNLRRSKIAIFERIGSGERRARLEQAGELSSLVAENLRRQGEPYRLFQDSYPYPIARAVRRFKHSSSPAEKHEAALLCVEALILSLGIVSLSLSAQRGWGDLAEVQAWVTGMQQGGVSLGHWVGVIRATGTFARGSGDEAAGLAKATAPKKGGKGLMADLGSLVEMRNKIRHGAGPRTRAEVERSLENLEKPTFRALAASSFLARMSLVHTSKLRWLPNIGKYEVTGLELMGDHPDFEPAVFETDRPLADDRLYMVTRQGEVLPLWPFCVLDDCPTCLTPEVYYPDRLKGTTALLKSLDRGHELEREEVFEDLKRWTAAVSAN